MNAVLNLLDSLAMFRNIKVVIQNYRENLFTDISTADTNQNTFVTSHSSGLTFPLSVKLFETLKNAKLISFRLFMSWWTLIDTAGEHCRVEWAAH